LKIKSVLNISTDPGVNEYQFLEIILNDYNHLTGQHTL